MSGLVNDPTLRMLAERSRQARKDAETQPSHYNTSDSTSQPYGELSDRLYALLLKNVSRDSPLSPEEIEVSLPTMSCAISISLTHRLYMGLLLYRN